MLAHVGLFRLGVAADAAMAMADVALAVLLYLLLRSVSPALSLTAMVFRLVQSAIIGTNLLNQQTALLMLSEGLGGTGTPAASAFSTDQLAMLAAYSLERHAYGYDLGLLFFGVNCLLVGYLVIRAGFLPTLLGYALAASGIVYLVGSTLRILAPALSDAFALAYIVPLLAESALALWLLLRGVDRGAFGKRTAEPSGGERTATEPAISADARNRDRTRRPAPPGRAPHDRSHRRAATARGSPAPAR